MQKTYMNYKKAAYVIYIAIHVVFLQAFFEKIIF